MNSQKEDKISTTQNRGKREAKLARKILEKMKKKFQGGAGGKN